MDKTLQNMETTARELIGIATGKKQVPITIFYLVVFVLGAWMILDKLSTTKANVNLTPTGTLSTTGGEGGGTNGSNNPPYLTINFIIRV